MCYTRNFCALTPLSRPLAALLVNGECKLLLYIENCWALSALSLSLAARLVAHSVSRELMAVVQTVCQLL